MAKSAKLIRDDLPYTMRIARSAKRMQPGTAAWFYVNPDNIEVFCRGVSGDAIGATLTRDQLARALQIMQQYAGNGSSAP